MCWCCVKIHLLSVQFLSGRSESCGQPETFHRKTGHRSAHGEKTSCSGVFFLSLDSDIYNHINIIMCFFSVHSLLFSLRQIKQVQDEERKQLTQLRDVLKTALQVEQKEVTTHMNTHWSTEGRLWPFNVKEHVMQISHFNLLNSCISALKLYFIS